MKKKILIGTIFPLTAMLALIGSGFSLWLFEDDSKVSLDTKVGIQTTDVLTSGNILVYNDCYWPDYKTQEGKENDRSYENYSYIEFDQVLDESQDYNLLKHPSDKKSTSAYYLWSNNDSITKSINKDNEGYTRNYFIDTKTGIPFENLGKEGGTDIIFTTSIVVPIEIAPYITMTYNTRNTHDQLQNRGFNKIIGSQVDKYDEDFSMTYTIIERYSDIDPDGTYAKEIFSDNLDDYINHDYKDDTNKKYGFKFFDWNNINIKYFNEEVFDKEDHGTLSEEEIADIKAWHKTQPSSLAEYEEMIKELSDIEGKTDNEQFNYKIALGVTYKAEICYYDSERASQTNN